MHVISREEASDLMTEQECGSECAPFPGGRIDAGIGLWRDEPKHQRPRTKGYDPRRGSAPKAETSYART